MPKYSYEKKDNTYLTPGILIQKALTLLASEKNEYLINLTVMYVVQMKMYQHIIILNMDRKMD